jgi:hypothetical protein
MSFNEAFRWCFNMGATIYCLGHNKVLVDYTVKHHDRDEYYALRGEAQDQDATVALIRAVESLIHSMERLRKQEITLDDLIAEQRGTL